ncbi:MAG: hypothetical protein M1839_003247 [Geoglossum umbratile]|nr:MAG: hypothetical protein M1839_003247 [Geoglossum umbratile]
MAHNFGLSSVEINLIRDSDPDDILIRKFMEIARPQNSYIFKMSSGNNLLVLLKDILRSAEARTTALRTPQFVTPGAGEALRRRDGGDDGDTEMEDLPSAGLGVLANASQTQTDNVHFGESLGQIEGNDIIADSLSEMEELPVEVEQFPSNSPRDWTVNSHQDRALNSPQDRIVNSPQDQTVNSRGMVEDRTLSADILNGIDREESSSRGVGEYPAESPSQIEICTSRESNERNPVFQFAFPPYEARDRRNCGVLLNSDNGVARPQESPEMQMSGSAETPHVQTPPQSTVSFISYPDGGSRTVPFEICAVRDAARKVEGYLLDCQGKIVPQHQCYSYLAGLDEPRHILVVSDSDLVKYRSDLVEAGSWKLPSTDCERGCHKITCMRV